jgi:hypothetical protein
MNPPAGESYFPASRRGGGARLRAAAAAPGGWELATEKLEAFEELAHLRLDQQDRERLAQLAEVDAFALAVALEKAVNGTSLVLMFELGDAYLLFRSLAPLAPALLLVVAELVLELRPPRIGVVSTGSHAGRTDRRRGGSGPSPPLQ